MSCAEALRRCPSVTFVPPRMALYREYSQEVWSLVREVVPTVEQAGIDEGYLDLGEVAPDFDDARALAEAVQAVIRARTRLSCSLGLASSKVVAKVASDRRKPGGLTVVRPGREAAFLAPLAIRLLPGRRPARRGAARRRRRRDDRRARRARRRRLARAAAGQGRAACVRDRARGIDPRGLEVSTERISISHEETFAQDVADPERLHDELTPDGASGSPSISAAAARRPARSRRSCATPTSRSARARPRCRSAPTTPTASASSPARCSTARSATGPARCASSASASPASPSTRSSSSRWGRADGTRRLDRIAHVGIDLMNPMPVAKLDEVLDLLALEAGARVVDLGCGKGELLRRLAARYEIRGHRRRPLGRRSSTRRGGGRPAGVTFVVADLTAFSTGAPFDLAAALGASVGGYRATLARLAGPRPPGRLCAARRGLLAPRAERRLPGGARRDARRDAGLRRPLRGRGRGRPRAALRRHREHRRLRPLRVALEPERRALRGRASRRAGRRGVPRLDPKRQAPLRRARRPGHARLRALPLHPA